MSKKVCILSGVSSGIGLSFCKQLLEEGYTVHGLSLTENNWPNVKAVIGDHDNLRLHLCDVSDEASVQKLIQEVIDKEGQIDLLVNNAGYIDSGFKLEEISTEEFKKNIDVNLYSVYFMCKYAIPYMKSPGKCIINISSNAGKRAVPTIAAYSAAKFGVVALSQSIAKENLGNGLVCYCVCPGGTNTPMREKIFGDAEKQQSPDFVVQESLKLLNSDVPSGSDIIIRHHKVQVNEVPGV